MIALILLAFILLHGLVLTDTCVGKQHGLIKLSAGFLLGSIISISAIYWLANVTRSLDLSIALFFFFSIQAVLVFYKKYRHALATMTLTPMQIVLLFGTLLSSYYFFAKSFGYDGAQGNFLIASNVYLDFGAHIPFIRSFSMGNNFPSEVPFLQNTGLLYYFLFDFYTGAVEHLGFRIDIALNLLSAFSFTSLIFLIYRLSYGVFHKKKVGVLSVAFFLFSSNLSFLTFFQKYGLKFSTFFHWWHNNFYFEGMPTILVKRIISFLLSNDALYFPNSSRTMW